MKLHNLMEDIVQMEIDKVCEAKRQGNTAYDFDTGEQRRFEAACYALNRLPPRYFISGRGLAHEEQNIFEGQQLEADITALVLEALRRVSRHKRDTAGGMDDYVTQGGVFNLPVIIGRIFDGATFNPLANISVELWREGERALMKNAQWKNPCFLSPQTAGAYTFWPASVPASTVGEKRTFNFLLRAEAPGYEPLAHHLSLSVESERATVEMLSTDRTFKVNDLYVFAPESAF
jgi:competence protein ComFB